MPQEQVWTLMADTHSGAKTGLTTNPGNAVQEQVFKLYKDAIKWAGRPDVVVHNGDGWDGKDEKSDDIDEKCMFTQATDCADLIVMQNPRKEVILVTGTEYHVKHKGQEFTEACKKQIQYQMLKKHRIADFPVTITRKLKTKVNGWFLMEARHFIGGSGIPHGRATAMLRSQVWNVMNAALSSAVRGQVAEFPHLIVYAHRHYFSYAKNAWGGALVLPSWQALGGVFGDEKCDGHVDLGLARLTIGKKESDGWRIEEKLYLPGVVDRTEHR